MIYIDLIIRFFKTGLFAMGGGLATLPFLQEISDETGWFTRTELANMFAISESTPGPIGVNMATYVGYTTEGVRGAITATLSLITPSIIIILIISMFLNKFKDNKYVNGAFRGIRPASAGLVAAAFVTMLKIVMFSGSGINWKALILMVSMFIAINIKPLKKLHPIVFIAVSAVLGNIFSFAV